MLRPRTRTAASALRLIVSRLGVLGLLTVMCLTFSSAVALAQDVAPQVTVEPGYGTSDDTFQLRVTVSGKMSSQLGRPEFDPSEDFDIESIGTSTRSEFVNGARSFQMTFTFLVVPKADLAPGEHPLPKGSMTIDGATVAIQPGLINILPKRSANSPNPPSKGSAAQPTDLPGRSASGIDFVQLIDNDEPYVGQQVVYRAEIAVSSPIANANLGDLETPGFLRESFGKNQEQRREVGGTLRYSILEALFPTRSGAAEIPTRSLSANIRVPITRQGRSGVRGGWGVIDEMFSELDAFQDFQVVTRRITAPGVKLQVKELPSSPPNVSGYIPVGDMKVSSRLDRKDVKQGDSVTLTIEITSDGNLKPFELPAPADKSADDFTVYVDQPQTEILPGRERLFFKKVFHVALIPKKAGKLFTPHYEIPSFNPKTGSYEFQHTGAAVLNVAPSAVEKLVIKGADAEPDGAGAPKSDIERLGEDLYPVHVGEELYAENSPMSAGTLRLLLLLPPMLAVLLAFATLYNRRQGDPAKARRFGAAKNVRAAVSAAESFEAVSTAFRSYLGDKLHLQGESLTSTDVRARLAPSGLPDDLGEKITTLLSKFQSAIYGGAPGADAVRLQQLKDETLNVVSDVEKHAPK